jgi:hypothetical protein
MVRTTGDLELSSDELTTMQELWNRARRAFLPHQSLSPETPLTTCETRSPGVTPFFIPSMKKIMSITFVPVYLIPLTLSTVRVDKLPDPITL